MKKLNTAETPMELEVQEIVNSYAEEYSDIKNYINDILQHGVQSGIVGTFTYYNETDEFYEKHKEEIWDLVNELAEEQGFENIFDFLRTLNGSEYVCDDTTLRWLLSVLAFEETVRRLAIEAGLIEE